MEKSSSRPTFAVAKTELLNPARSITRGKRIRPFQGRSSNPSRRREVSSASELQLSATAWSRKVERDLWWSRSASSSSSRSDRLHTTWTSYQLSCASLRYNKSSSRAARRTWSNATAHQGFKKSNGTLGFAPNPNSGYRTFWPGGTITSRQSPPSISMQQTWSTHALQKEATSWPSN